MRSSRPLVGREQELEDLGKILGERGVRVVCIEGESGCGKTALATAAIDKLLQARVQRIAPIFLARSGQLKGLEDWLLTELASSLATTVPSNATSIELGKIITLAAESAECTVFIDNAESLDYQWLASFIKVWLLEVSVSKLIITSTRAMALSEPGYCRYLLGGLRHEEEEAILSFLGTELQGRFDLVDLLEAAKQLGNFPQRLLYLRWLNPESRSQLAEVAAELSGEAASAVLVASIRKRTGGFIDHYLALGHVRTLRFDEELLATLWDSLGGGSAASYVAIREQILNEGLLVRTSEEGLRINPGVHVQLEKQLASSLGIAHLPHVDYFLSEYFRRRFEKSATSDLQYLGHYAYHSARCGNLLDSAEYVLSDSRLEILRGRGLTVALSRVLMALDEELDAARNSSEREGRWRDEDLLRLKCRTVLELARCRCELSEYADCLEVIEDLDQAVRSLEQTTSFSDFKRRMSILRGISFGCLGRLEECIRSYISVVVDALDSGGVDAGAIEALGYAAMVTSYIDMERALSLGAKSLELAESLGDGLILTKNQCSFGQILLYADRPVEAVEFLAAAEAWCRGDNGNLGDRRELGRVLIPGALATMAKGGNGALRLAEEALEINAEIGDRRRHARAGTALALAILNAGQRERGKGLLNEALESLYASQDWLNLVLGSLTFGYVEGIESVDEMVRVTAEGSAGGRWAELLREAVSNHRIVPALVKFFECHYLPFLRRSGI